MEAPATSTSMASVTGAGGFLASWLVKLLRSSPPAATPSAAPSEITVCGSKNAHLMELEGAGERLRLVKVDILDYSSVALAVAGCEGVFHVASPVPSGPCPNPEADIIAPAVTGTLNVLKACYEAKVKRVVVEFGWYFLSKTLVEHEEAVENRFENFVDVRDVADALLLAYENPKASGRYLCISTLISVSDIINILKTLYPAYNYPKNFVEVGNIVTCNTEKLEKLGWSFRPMKETLRDSVESYRALGGMLN
ncbi:hypothetical protein BAE44_0020912 [Dichanthelium oligosanthes]|uniref:NAD-dependent epimerase/dehydratase domain-containing protein n=1 Tax=Dichanthelium oligosanthes TaxID=888268 RepID=A0A1E5UYU8_9POAL|nr:hypothetical protein BAE44_0020912 [Dichanthelium oligosanthes]